MYKEKHIFQEFCSIDNPRGCGAGGFIADKNHELKEIANERYDSLLEGYKNHDNENHIIRINFSKKCTFNHRNYDAFVIFNNKIQTGEFESQYPLISFDNYKERILQEYSNNNFFDIGKQCRYVIEGSRKDIAHFMLFECGQSIEEFKFENPTLVEKMTRQDEQEISISCNKKNAAFLREYLKNIKNSYKDLTATIDEKNSKTEKKWNVKLFNSECLFNVKLKGVKLEVKFIIELLALEKKLYKLI
jgi:hypothetical protein